jgi:hypothetical protein
MSSRKVVWIIAEAVLEPDTRPTPARTGMIGARLPRLSDLFWLPELSPELLPELSCTLMLVWPKDQITHLFLN